MAIYAWPGIEVEITEACFAPIWIEERYSEIKRHLSEPKPTKRTRKITPQVGWFVRLKAVEDGKMLRGGKWDEMHALRANDGITELYQRFHALVGAAELAKLERWNKEADLTATELWPLIPTKEAA